MQIGQLTNGFDEFLKTLDSDRDKASEKYLRLRTRLERFFEWRNCENIEELTDIVFDRTAKKIVEGEKLLNVEAYCVSVAKFVLLENRREAYRTDELDENTAIEAGKGTETDKDVNETRFKCLDSCLAKFPDEDRALIIRYFDTNEATMIPTRKTLAESLGISINSLRIRICRLRSKLENCTKKCCESA